MFSISCCFTPGYDRRMACRLLHPVTAISSHAVAGRSGGPAAAACYQISLSASRHCPTLRRSKPVLIVPPHVSSHELLEHHHPHVDPGGIVTHILPTEPAPVPPRLQDLRDDPFSSHQPEHFVQKGGWQQVVHVPIRPQLLGPHPLRRLVSRSLPQLALPQLAFSRRVGPIHMVFFRSAHPDPRRYQDRDRQPSSPRRPSVVAGSFRSLASHPPCVARYRRSSRRCLITSSSWRRSWKRNGDPLLASQPSRLRVLLGPQAHLLRLRSRLRVFLHPPQEFLVGIRRQIIQCRPSPSRLLLLQPPQPHLLGHPRPRRVVELVTSPSLRGDLLLLLLLQPPQPHLFGHSRLRFVPLFPLMSPSIPPLRCGALVLDRPFLQLGAVGPLPPHTAVVWAVAFPPAGAAHVAELVTASAPVCRDSERVTISKIIRLRHRAVLGGKGIT